MSDLRFYGASDDLVEVEGVVREEYSLPTSNVLDFIVERDNGSGEIEGCRVRARYTKLGTWAFEVAQLEEGFRLPWPMRIESAHDYSVALWMDVPSDVRVEAEER